MKSIPFQMLFVAVLLTGIPNQAPDAFLLTIAAVGSEVQVMGSGTLKSPGSSKR